MKILVFPWDGGGGLTIGNGGSSTIGNKGGMAIDSSSLLLKGMKPSSLPTNVSSIGPFSSLPLAYGN